MMASRVYANAAEEGQLATESRHFDEDKAPDTQKVDTLAKQYNVQPETIQDLRSKGQGWGEVSIGMATAQELSKQDPKTYPTYGDALNKVESMRASGEGWGKIAKDLGFKLGPVISAARHTRNELGRAGSMNPHHDTEKVRPEHDRGHPLDGSSRPDTSGRPDHSARPDHPGKSERPGH
jgi:hypothetical protein